MAVDNAANQAKPLIVTVTPDGNQDKFLVGLEPSTFELDPGDQLSIPVHVKDLLTPANLNAATSDILYGTAVKIQAHELGDSTLLIDKTIYIYYFFDALDSNHTDNKIDFGKALNDGPGGAADIVPLTIDGPAGTMLSPTGSMFTYSSAAAKFDPTANGNHTGSLQIIAPDGQVDGNIDLAGDGVSSFVGPALSVHAAPVLAGNATPITARLAVDFGDAIADPTKTIYLFNNGSANLDINSIHLLDGNTGFSIDNVSSPSIAPQNTLAVTLHFTPTKTGDAADTLQIVTNSILGSKILVPLTGHGISASGAIDVTIPNDNAGGAKVGTVKTIAKFGTIENNGATDLTITGVQTGTTEFTVTGLGSGPFVLKPGQSIKFGISFDPGSIGLIRDTLSIFSSDPQKPVVTWGLLGTGVAPTGTALQYGNDYVVFDTPFSGSQPVRTVSDAAGNWSFLLPQNQGYEDIIFDPVSGLVAHGYGVTGPSGGTFRLNRPNFIASTANDSDFDGLPDDIEFALGTNAHSKDTNSDGIDDFTSLKLGINPLGGFGLPTGVVSSTNLNGVAEAVAVTGSAEDPSKLTAYVATGSAGLAIVDVSNFTKPVVLGQLALPGNSVDVAVDATRNIAAIASDAGLQLVDVSTPAAPHLITTVVFDAPVASVTLRDGIAYVAAGTNVAMVNIDTGEILQTLNLGATGGGTITGLAFGGNALFTFDANSNLRAFTLAGETLLVARGTLNLPASTAGRPHGMGQITVGGNIVYVEAGNGGTGGYMTVDASNLDNLTLAADVENNGIAGTSIALNGSGLGIAVGSSSFVFGGFKSLDVLNVADPANTGNFLSRIDLPAVPNDVALANGLAFVADGSGGLQIVNYLAVDTKGVPPTVAINVNAIDADPGTPGTQVVEGSLLNITPTITDDVQVRNVELLVNGKVVENDPAYPFEFSTLVPTIASGGNTVTIQVRAIDTGGNVASSNSVVLNVIKDTIPPTVTTTSITENARLFFVRSIDVTFDGPLDVTKLSLAGIHLVNVGPDGIAGTADDLLVPVTFDTRAAGQILSVVPNSFLSPGTYQLRLDPSVIFDHNGNALTSPLILDFSIRPASDVKAASGAPTITQAPSANPGQVIGLPVPFDPSTAFATFHVIDTNGTQSTRDIQVMSADAAKGIAYFQVPYDAITGDLVVYSKVGNTRTDFADGTFLLQIVPVLSTINVTSVASDGSSAQVTLTGLGFIEDNGTAYQFGGTTVIDTSVSTGPDVFNLGSTANGSVTLTVPLSANAFGPISVTTQGGTSALFSASLTGIFSTAMSGTPANAALPSANAGQAITLSGTGLSTSVDVIMTYTGSDGVVRTVLVNPAAAKADGTSATLIVPSYANGITTLNVLGSSTPQTLQVVPTLTSYSVDGTNTLRLFGSGLQEGSVGNTVTYNFAGGTTSDTVGNAGPDVYNTVSGSDNTAVYLPSEPVHGFGSVTTTTAGGTSAPLPLNEFETGLGLLRGIAIDPANPTHVWVADNANPASIHLIDTTTGQQIGSTPQQVSSIPITNVSGATNSIGNTSFYGSIQIVPQDMSLSFTPVPAGSLLVFYGPSNPDYVVALNPATGQVISSLQLAGNYDTTAGVYDPSTGELFVVDRNHSGGNRIVAIDPVSGTEDPNFTFNAPFNLGDGGLALDPATSGPNAGTLWLSSDQTGDIVQVTNTGTVLRHLTIGLQAPGNIGASGIAFDAAGNLLVATNQGVVLKLNVNFDAASFTPVPTLTAINATATNGTSANAALPSADAGQVITLSGTNFNSSTGVVFQIRDASGKTSQEAVAPLAINPAGTLLQVQVPMLATTGAVQVVNVSNRNLGFNTYNDAIYRGLTVQFTASSSTSAINFADGGLEGISNESWGIDNVAVTQGATTVFADNFESGTASGAWTQSVVDSSTPGAFTNFLGRFSNGGDTLNLSGLTAGQTYTVHFDLYALDSLDGQGVNLDGSGNIIPAQYGPDQLNVTVDGSQKLSLAMAYAPTEVQNFNGSGTLPLQIVPTLTSMDGIPSGDGTFNLFGSGFQAGAMTVTVGGVTLPDSQFTDQYQNHILGGSNAQDRIVAPLTLDGPVTVTTAGGSATLPGYSFAAQPQIQFTGITATASSGTPANGGAASANTGQTITLTGQGFTNSTLVLFQAEDASGVTGQVVRTGTAGNGGTTLSIVVPELARTGAVQVMGSALSYQLQIVPQLRSVGGIVQSGNTIELEASGLPPGEVTVQIDGRGVGTFSIRNTYDVNPFSVGSPLQTQQILTLTVPQAIGPGLITVQTSGGTATLQAGRVITAIPDFVPAVEAGDTIATAVTVGLPVNATIKVPGTVGDGANTNKDVDLYALALTGGETLSVQWSGNFYSQIRLFNAAGQQVGTQYGSYVSPNQTGVVAQFMAPTSGTYYLGVSGYPNTNYDPKIAASGTGASYTGPYSLTLERLQAGATRLTGITATAASGTAANAGVASANPGQTITLTGSGLLATDQVVFTSVDDNGDLFTQTVSPSTVAPNGSSLTVVIPSQAITGTVRLARDPVGLLLQVVPTLTHVDMNVNGAFNGGSGTVTGSGFTEGMTTLNFGSAKLVDTARDSNGLDIYNTGHTLSFTTPNGVATGPVSVTTVGGTSAVYGLSFTGITSAPLSGTAATGGQAAANPGQLITLQGNGFDASTDVVFATVDDGGNTSQIVIHPIATSADGTNATVVVPVNAITGVVRVVGDLNGNAVPLQIVPSISSLVVNSVASDGSSATVTLHGAGFVDGRNTVWKFGSVSIIDASSANQGPDVYSSGTTAYLTIPLNGAFGPIAVTTQGGTSAAFGVSLAGVIGTAMSGTPANAVLPSANAGQAVTLTGTGLSTAIDVIMTYTGSDGVVRTVMLNPTAAKADGSAATFVVPTYANGVITLNVLGSSTPQTLQVVPTLTSYSIDGTNTLRLFGSGLQEGSAGNTVTYNFAGGTTSDTVGNAGPDVYNVVSGSDNTAVYLPSEPVHGFGNVTTTTAGGTSAPLPLNELETGFGLLRSVAMNTANPTQLWVADNANPAALHLIDTTTGQQIRSVAITKVSNATNSIGNTSFYGALQVVPAAFTLRSTPIPAGSLLVFYGPANPDYVVALNPTTGNAIGNLPLLANYETTAGVYDPTTGELFIVDRNHSGGNRVVGIYATTGNGHTAGDEDPAHTFASPFNLGDGAIALDPSGDGTLWLGSDQSGDIVHITNTGTILKTVSISPQAPGAIGVSGMVFDASGNLLVATNQGVILKLNVNFDAASFTPTPTLTGINGTATSGSPANAALPSADAGQFITLTGTNFNSSTQVVFPIRDASGNTAQFAVTPNVIGAGGTSLQVQVPMLATTGAIQVVNVSNRNLGFNTYNDAIYRGLTVQFTAASSTSAINFADGGLQGLSDESWGIDNVVVTQGATTVFADNFESGIASGAWTQSVVDSSTPGVFTKFLGRFSNGGDTLNLSGLTAGQTYTVHFDLYALDSLDGQGGILDGSGNIIPAQYGPDQLNVTVDGSQKLSLAMSYTTTSVQNFNGSGTLPLQIVPTLTSMDGSPSGDGTFNLFGSGFQAGAMTVTVGGVTLPDSQFTDQYQNHILGGSNAQDRIVAPLTLDGPITVTTAGGSATLPGYPYVGAPGVIFTGITAVAGGGVPAASGPSANVGQTIVLNGQGFTAGTLVQFAAEDASGTHGTVTRTGTPSADGRSLSIVVPALARSGTVTVLGSGTSFALQVVPLLRAVGGTVVAGNTIELDTTGVTPGELTVTIDGHTATVVGLRDTVDINSYTVSNPIAGQQLLKVIVPAGVTVGTITIATPGGSASLSTGVTIASQPGFSPSGEAGDTLASATAITVPANASIVIPGTVGDGPFGTKDVDLYQVTLGAGDALNVVLTGNLYSQVRFFNAAGQQLGTQFGSYISPNTTNTSAQFVAPAAGTYFVGITGYNNISYDPTVAGSGTAAGYTGAYTLTLERMVAGGTRISSISSTAASGTPAVAGIASANAGATITLNGTGLVASDQVVFTGLESGGNLYSITVNASTVAVDGSSLTVVVPTEATTGAVRLARDVGGILLQVVPTITHLDITSSPQLTGSGFAEGLTSLNFGVAKLVDTARDASGLDIYNTNHYLNFSLPKGVEGGPFSVTTPGGTSAIYGVTFTGITASASSGTPTNAGQASANAGQTITIHGSNLDTSTDVVFRTIDDGGNRSQIVVHPATAAVDGLSATVVVPGNAVTDVVRILGDATGSDIPLQIVPVVTTMTVTSVNSDGSFAAINLNGSGFVEGNGSAYKFGGTVVSDAVSYNEGPDVFGNGTQVNLSVPLNPASFGPVIVTTAGGSSAPVTLTATLTAANATATSGTPANAALPSANPGQTITLSGSGLTTATGIIGFYTGSDNTVRFVLLYPATAAADGTSATLVVPSYFNGITQLDVIGAANPMTLQIVPTLTKASVDGTDTLRLFGTGLQEGSANNVVAYNFSGGSITDTVGNGGPDVYNTVSGSDNTAVYLPSEPVHGFGTVTTTTAGGTSAPLSLNEMQLADGYLRDVAMDPSTPGQAWVIDNGNPAKLHLVNTSTGAEIRSITLTSGVAGQQDFGSTAFFGGMQIVPPTPAGQTALTLNGVAVAAGSILLFDGQTNPDRIIAVNATTGQIISTLVLAKNYDMTAGVYDPFSGRLYITDRTTNPTSIVAINPATGAEIANSRFNLPVNAGEAGLALDPSGDGTLWYGSDQSNNLYHLSATGTVLQIDDLTLQGVVNNEINGLSFDNNGKLLVASKLGVVYRVTV